VDQDGYFFTVDRLKRMIKASGFKVWPSEVESFMYGHLAVLEACVIGTSDAHRGVPKSGTGKIQWRELQDRETAAAADRRAPP
jgi:hypothetical protein